MHNRIRLLVDNASLDAILGWESEVRSRFSGRVASRHIVVYLAPENVAEMLAIGATTRADKLGQLATLMLDIFNGRMLNHYFWRILDEVRGRNSGPFLAARVTRRIVENIKQAATKGGRFDTDWFSRGAELIRQEKVRDQRWRTGFQQMYRERDRTREHPHTLKDFVRTSAVRELVLSRVEAICTEAGVPNPTNRASEIVQGEFKRFPAIADHVFLRVARLWWYTECTRDGRRVGADLFDDALLHYLTGLDVLLSPDRALVDFGQTVFPDTKLISPDAFRTEFLTGGP